MRSASIGSLGRLVCALVHVCGDELARDCHKVQRDRQLSETVQDNRALCCRVVGQHPADKDSTRIDVRFGCTRYVALPVVCPLSHVLRLLAREPQLPPNDVSLHHPDHAHSPDRAGFSQEKALQGDYARFLNDVLKYVLLATDCNNALLDFVHPLRLVHVW